MESGRGEHCCWDLVTGSLYHMSLQEWNHVHDLHANVALWGWEL